LKDYSMPNVSVIMNCYNGAEFLRDAIDSVYAQTYNNWEIILWDDDSDDNTREIASSYDKKLRYFKGQKAKNLGEVRNRAIRKARGKLLAFLDQDDKWLPKKLEMQISKFDSENVGLVYSNFYYYNKKTGSKNVAFKKNYEQKREFKDFLRNYNINMQTAIIRNLPENRFNPMLTISEEYELFMLILSRSKTRYVSVPLSIYQIHDGMQSLKKIHLYPYEMQTALETFNSEIDGFKDKYKSEIRYLRFKIEYYKARAAMAVGDRSKALALLIHSEGSIIKRGFLVFLVVLGKRVWHKIHEITNRYH